MIEEYKATEEREARFAISMNLGSLCSQRLRAMKASRVCRCAPTLPRPSRGLDALMDVAEQAALWQELADSLEDCRGHRHVDHTTYAGSKSPQWQRTTRRSHTR